MKAWGWIVVPVLILAALIAAKEWGVREGKRWAVEHAARDTVRVVDSLYVRDTVTLTKWRDVVRVKRESLTITDTIQVREFIALQDSAFGACTSALKTCERRVSARDTLIRVIEKRGGARRFPNVTAGAFVGTDGSVKLGIGVGVRIF